MKQQLVLLKEIAWMGNGRAEAAGIPDVCCSSKRGGHRQVDGSKSYSKGS